MTVRIEHNFELFQASPYVAKDIGVTGKDLKRCVCLNCVEARQEWEDTKEQRARLALAQRNTIFKRDLVEKVEKALSEIPEYERDRFAAFFLAGLEERIRSSWLTWRNCRAERVKK